MQLCSYESGAATVDVKSDLLTDMLFLFNIDVRKKIFSKLYLSSEI